MNKRELAKLRKWTDNLPNIEKFLTENKIAKPTGNYAASGYCVYPEYEFDLTKFERGEL